MNHFKSFLFVILVFSLALVACGGEEQIANTVEDAATRAGNTGDTGVSAPTVTAKPTVRPEPTATPRPTATPQPAVDLGDEMRSEEGGFSFRPIAGYETEGFGEVVLMIAPDADPDLGPQFVLSGGPLEGDTVENILNEILADAELEVGAAGPRPITVNGISGLSSDFSAVEGEQELKGRVSVLANETQAFILFGGAEGTRWDSEIAEQFNAVLDTVRLFSPGVAATDDGDGAAPADMSRPVGSSSSEPGIACFGSGGEGISCLDAAGNWQTYTRESSPLGGDFVQTIAVCGDELLIVHSSGLNTFDGENWGQIDRGWGFGSPSDAACDDRGGLWVAHFEGVSYYDGTTWTTYDAEELATGESASDLVEAVALDSSGNVWVATANAIAMFDGSAWTIYQIGQGLVDKYFFDDINVDSAGTVWAAHSQGLLAFSDGAWTPYKNDDFFSLESMAPDGAGNIWVGTFSDGLYLFDGSAWSSYSTANSGLESDHVRAIAIDGNSRLWLATDWGLHVFDDGVWTVYRMDNADIVDNDIFSVAVLDGGPRLPALVTKDSGSLDGSVTRDGAPLGGAPVEICVQKLGFSYFGDTPCSDQPLFFSTMTDASGAFSFDNVPPGLYIITINTGDSWAQLTTEFGFGSERVPVYPGENTDVGQLTITD